MRRAYAAMLGRTGDWRRDDVTVQGRSLRSYRLRGEHGGEVRQVFVGLHDGRPDGAQSQSLQRLYTRRSQRITAYEGGAGYDERRVVGTVRALLRTARAQRVVTLDPDVASFGYTTHSRGTDHSDHAVTARYVREAAFGSGVPVTYFRGYAMSPLPANLTPPQVRGKDHVARWYVALRRCDSTRDCRQVPVFRGGLRHDWSLWVRREYPRRTEAAPAPGAVQAEVGRVTRTRPSPARQCLAAPGGGRGAARLAGCDGGGAQRWQLRRDRTLRPRAQPGSCLTASGGRARLLPCREARSTGERSTGEGRAGAQWRAAPWKGPNGRAAHGKHRLWRLADGGGHCLFQDDRNLPRPGTSFREPAPAHPRLTVVSCQQAVRAGLFWRVGR